MERAHKIPEKYVPTVRKALIAAAAIGPVGLFGGIDAVAVGGVWATMFFSIREKADSQLGSDPKRIALSAAKGLVTYYIGCKVAAGAMFLLPAVGPLVAVFAAMGVSSLCNIYFTYRFAAALIEFMDTKESFSDDDIIGGLISLLKRLPSVEEVKEIGYIYKGQ